MAPHLYPARFREEYDVPLEQQFLDDYRDARGLGARILFWFHVLAHLAISIPLELARELSLSPPLPGNHAVLRGLPFRNPGALVELHHLAMPPGWLNGFNQWRAHSGYLADSALYVQSEVNLATTGEAVRVKVAETTANFVGVLGTDPQFGRAFTAGE